MMLECTEHGLVSRFRLYCPDCRIAELEAKVGRKEQRLAETRMDLAKAYEERDSFKAKLERLESSDE